MVGIARWFTKLPGEDKGGELPLETGERSQEEMVAACEVGSRGSVQGLQQKSEDSSTA